MKPIEAVLTAEQENKYITMLESWTGKLCRDGQNISGDSLKELPFNRTLKMIETQMTDF